MLNDSEYRKLIENTHLIAGYLAGKLNETREPITIGFGEMKSYGMLTKKEYTLCIGHGCIDVLANNGRTSLEFTVETDHRKDSTVCLFGNRCPASEQMMIKLCRDWQEIKSRISVALQAQQKLRDMINNFEL